MEDGRWRRLARVVAFLLGFGVLLIGVSYYYLFPAMDAAHHATTQQKKTLAVYSRLVLAVVLFVLLALFLLTFRIGRFFFPRATPPRTKTKYVDAWTESGRRLPPPPPE